MLRQRAHAVAPLSEPSAAANVGFGQVVDHEALGGKFLYEFNRGGQMARVNQNVVCVAVTTEVRDAAKEILAKQKAIVGLCLHDVTESNERLKF